ncbi:MAG: cupin-like domain-containing protein [Chitinophagales bacterium]|nr:cupin-like domain-containing protein [Chitinophagales bacterium]MDW8417782.1 cupin-like domain-containing protein [Chitinophagales bacterium]
MLPERVSGLSVKEFYTSYLQKSIPVIITDVVTGWHSYREWSIDSFAKKYGHKAAGVMRIKNGLSDADTYNERNSALVPVQRIIESVSKGLHGADIVLASPIDALKPEIDYDVAVPEYCRHGKFFRSRIYVGPGGLVTSLHQDLPENFYALIRGRKHITLFKPADRKYLYPNPVWSRHPNFARYNPDKPDNIAFQRARFAQPVEVYLQEGEMLYIPSLWWHHIRNLEPSIAVNFWWSVGWKVVPAWGLAKLKQILNG